MSGQCVKVANWREQILKEFTPGAARITLVADPDGLLLEETIQAAIRGKGFELVTFENSADFPIRPRIGVPVALGPA